MARRTNEQDQEKDDTAGRGVVGGSGGWGGIFGNRNGTPVTIGNGGTVIFGVPVGDGTAPQRSGGTGAGTVTTPPFTDSGVNRAIIDEAIRNLPIPIFGGQRPPIQTGPTAEQPPISARGGPNPAATPQVTTEQLPTSQPVTIQGPTSSRGGPNPVYNPPGGQVPPAPGGGSGDDDSSILDQILKNIPFIFGGGNGGGGDVSQVPTDDGFFDWLFGGSTSQGGNASNSNIIQDLIGAVTGGSADNALSNVLGDIGNTVINAGITDYVADSQLQANRDALDLNRYIYDSGVDRLEPFRQAGLEAFPALQAAANNTPTTRDLFSGVHDAQAGSRSMRTIDPTVNVNLPTANNTAGLPELRTGSRTVALGDASPVSVNNFDPYNPNDPVLQRIIESGTDAIEGSAVARGGLLSGDTLEDLQELGQTAALSRAGDIQAIESARDATALGAQNQQFGQQTTNANINNQLNQQDLSNSSGIRSQLFGEGNTLFGQELSAAGLDAGIQGQEFGQELGLNNFTNLLNLQDFDQSAYRGDTTFNRNLSANQFYQNADSNQFGQLFELSRLGQNAAAGQGAGGAAFSNIGANILQNQGDIRTARTSGFTNALAGLF